MVTWREYSDAAKGWLYPAEREALFDYAVRAHHETWAGSHTFVEIGGYCGKSAIVLGAVAQEYNAVLFSIDWHRGSPEMAPDRECHDPDMIGADGLFDSLPHFRRNIRAAGLEDHVVAIVGTSGQVGASCIDLPCSLLFIDGAHDEFGVRRDYERWSGNVTDEGYLIFHDATIPCIGAVAERACREGFEFVEQVESMRILRRRAR